MNWEIQLRGEIGSLSLDVEFQVETGPVVLVGPNGAGKTTLLRAIAGAALPLSGRIVVGDRVFSDSQKRIHVPVHERRIGYVPQGYGLFEHLTAEANVAFGCGRGESARSRATAALKRMNATDLVSRYPEALSAGEKQRVALARVLAIEPVAMLLDEPLSALDVASRRGVRAHLVKHVQDAKCPTLLVTHDLRDARVVGGTILVMVAGAIEQSGTYDEIRKAPANDFVAEFFDLERDP